MKDILIVVSPTSSPHLDVCKKMKLEALRFGKAVQPILESAFLINGPKSFEIAMSLHRIAFEGRLPVAIFEIDSVLLEPSRDEENHP